MKTVRLIQKEIDRAMSENLNAQSAAKERGAEKTALIYGLMAIECNNILSAIDKIVEDRKQEIRRTVIMSLLGACVAIAAAILW